MRLSALPIFAILSTLSSVYAVSLSVKNGCILYTDANFEQKSLCQGSVGQISDISIDVYACVDPSTGTSACRLLLDEVNLSQKVFWGSDDCLYRDEGY
ncbi:MAG: hypothetical protein Q9170_007208, partial [Blastenia crenularia]